MPHRVGEADVMLYVEPCPSKGATYYLPRRTDEGLALGDFGVSRCLTYPQQPRT